MFIYAAVCWKFYIFQILKGDIYPSFKRTVHPMASNSKNKYLLLDSFHLTFCSIIPTFVCSLPVWKSLLKRQPLSWKHLISKLLGCTVCLKDVLFSKRIWKIWIDDYGNDGGLTFTYFFVNKFDIYSHTIFKIRYTKSGKLYEANLWIWAWYLIKY